MSKYYTDFVSDTILLSIGRAILRKEKREGRDISDDEVVRAFNYVKQRQLESVSKKISYLGHQSLTKNLFLN